jgi:hypothetical protein
METDGEFTKFLEMEGEENKKLEEVGNELDDFFFSPTDDENEK